MDNADDVEFSNVIQLTESSVTTDENYFEDIEYLDVADGNYIAEDDVYLSETNNNTNQNVNNEPTIVSKVFLFVLLCLIFLANWFSVHISESNTITKKVEKLIVKIKELQKENFGLRCSAKRQSAAHNIVLKNSKNLEDRISKIFNQDQMHILKNNLKRPKKWDDKTILKSLKLKFACRKRGYTNLINEGHPLPSLRILRKRLQGIDFNPGILNDVFTFLKEKVKSFTNSEKECVLVIDEMSIVEGNYRETFQNPHSVFVLNFNMEWQKQCMSIVSEDVTFNTENLLCFVLAVGVTDLKICVFVLLFLCN